MFDLIGKYATYKMVNDMKEILDQQEGMCYLWMIWITWSTAIFILRCSNLRFLFTLKLIYT